MRYSYQRYTNLICNSFIKLVAAKGATALGVIGEMEMVTDGIAG